MTERDPAAVAREIIDANRHMILATADADGVPWSSPMWVAHDRHREFVLGDDNRRPIGL